MWRGPDLSKIHGDDHGKGYFTTTLYISGVSMALRLGVKRGNEHNLKRRALRNLSSDAQMVHIISSFNVKDEHISATLGAPGGIRLALLVVGAIAGVANVCCHFQLSNASRPSLESACKARSITPHAHLRTFAAGHT